jgi:hypothetical protein
VITPRRTQLVRVPNLHAFRHAIAELCSVAGRSPTPSGDEVVVVPTTSAAKQLRRSLDGPALVTRDELYDVLHGRLADPPRRLGSLEREVMAQAAARAAAAATTEHSFRLRPGLVAEMLRFYDQLRRQSQQVTRFEELIAMALGSDDLDRAAERMRRQTHFLADAFRDYERRVASSGGCDEHTLRQRLIDESAAIPIRHVVVTVADWIADDQGLYVADFDLLTRISGLERLDIVVTEAMLGSGLHERLHNWWPGLDEIKPTAAARVRPMLVTPPAALPDEPWWTFRDREEELVAVARRLKADRRSGESAPLERTAVVFKNPLP